MLKTGITAELFVDNSSQLELSDQHLATVEVQGTVSGIAIACHKGQMLTFDMETGKGVENSEGYYLRALNGQNIDLAVEIVKNLLHAVDTDTVSDASFRDCARVALKNVLKEIES